MRALVTGGAGFIGSALVDRLLAEGHAVDVIDDLSSGSLANLAEARADRSQELKVHQVDIRDPAVVDVIGRRQPEVVFHLAAQADVRVSVARPAFDAEVNVIGSINVLEGARVARARKVVFASSGGTIYGEAAPRDLPCKESHPQNPGSPYGVTKRVAFDYLSVYRQLHGLEFTALALSNVYGPRQDPHGEAGVVAIFAGRLLADQVCTIYGDGEQTRDFVNVRDVSRANLLAAQTRGVSGAFNIASGTRITINRLAELVTRESGAPTRVEYGAPRKGDVRHSLADISAARDAFGYAPAVDLEDGLREYMEWSRRVFVAAS